MALAFARRCAGESRIRATPSRLDIPARAAVGGEWKRRCGQIARRLGHRGNESRHSASTLTHLYWRAALAATSADAERDYKRVVVEYPLSERAGDALFQLAQLEVARGDRAAATTHLDRFLLENPASDDRGRAGLMLVRLAFDQNEPQHACVALRRALQDVPATEVELHNQLRLLLAALRECRQHARGRRRRQRATRRIATAQRPAPRVATRRRRRARRRRATRSRSRHTARELMRMALAKRLKARGIDVRVSGTARMFRVRIGHYETRAAAAAAARDLKAKKIDAFVTEIGGDDK